MNQSYVFDSFENDQKKSEIERLTKNIGSHSKALCEYFLNHGLMSSQKVLDVGCGTGAMLNMFADLLPQTEFVGLDNSNEILSNTLGNDKSNIKYKFGEASQLPFADDTFDLVYTRLVLMHNHDPIGIVNEMRRVCKPNGIIISIEIDDETMIFYPYERELFELIHCHIEYARRKGTDRTMGRKLYSIFKLCGMNDVKVMTQTSDYEGPYDEIPFPLRLALGGNEGRHLVEADLISEDQRVEYVQKVEMFCKDPNRFYSGSFMYCHGIK